jgi:hypothetical protein
LISLLRSEMGDECDQGPCPGFIIYGRLGGGGERLPQNLIALLQRKMRNQGGQSPRAATVIADRLAAVSASLICSGVR